MDRRSHFARKSESAGAQDCDEDVDEEEVKGVHCWLRVRNAGKLENDHLLSFLSLVIEIEGCKII